MIKCTLEPSLLERRPLTITQKGNEKRMSYLTFMVSESPKTMNDFLTKESKQWRLLGSQLSRFGYKLALFESPSSILFDFLFSSHFSVIFISFISLAELLRYCLFWSLFSTLYYKFKGKFEFCIIQIFPFTIQNTWST